MTLAELIASFRQDAGDKAEPYLWADHLVKGWLNEAQQEAAVRRRLLYGSAPAINVTTAAGRTYPFTGLFEVTHATLQVSDLSAPASELGIVSRDGMDRIDAGWRTRPGVPARLIVEDTQVVLGGAVERDYTLTLEGYRLPAAVLSADADTPEIAPVHHRFLVHWALHRAYSNQDADTFDAARAAREEAAFTAYFGSRPDADLRKDARADMDHHTEAFWL